MVCQLWFHRNDDSQWEVAFSSGHKANRYAEKQSLPGETWPIYLVHKVQQVDCRAEAKKVLREIIKGRSSQSDKNKCGYSPSPKQARKPS